MHRFDPMTNKLTKISVSPSFSNTTVAVVRNKIYFISSTLDVFNTKNQTWSTAPPPPTVMRFTTAVTYERWIIVTGYTKVEKRCRPQTWVYDTGLQEWILNNSIPPQKCFGHKLIMRKSILIQVGGNNFHNSFQAWHTGYFNVKHLFSDFRWDVMKHCILLRQLVGKGRAFPIVLNHPSVTINM